MAEGFKEIETITPIDYLRRAGAEVTVAATGSVNRTVMGAHGIPVTADTTLDAHLATHGTDLPDAVIVPGELPGATNIAKCQPALSFHI